ncbi:hypothetical protein BUALT_Bualt15G0029800 [Buddleja alternifolia]|uniref:Uncharacterized protein n=1 Tax=Buddleja alternifolia TaxID=168488 RepID=A0AAV6WDX2_9LAMI|nr:hypothetical protein BUALT_Bualt15G0029800 [Buddleja alternifolia]
MEFDELVAAMGGDEVLQPGEVYFELPLRWRYHRLQVEDMAALAMKAGIAISSSGGGGGDEIISCGCCGSRKIEPMNLMFSEKERPLLAVDGGGGGGGGGSKGHKFVAKLSAIVEE